MGIRVPSLFEGNARAKQSHLTTSQNSALIKKKREKILVFFNEIACVNGDGDGD